MISSRDKIGGAALAVAVGAFMIACVTPALIFHKTYAGGEPVTLYGYWCLIMGPVGLFSLQPAWLANIFIPVGGFLLLRREYRGAMFWSGLAIGLALTAVALFEQEVPVAAGGAKTRLHLLDIGYWLWLLCPVAVFAGAWKGNQLATEAAEEEDELA